MATHYLWLVIDNRTGEDRTGPELVAVTINECPYTVAGIPIAYADAHYIGEWTGEGIWPRTSTEAYLDWLGGEGGDEPPDCRIFDELEREQRRKRGA